MQPSANSTRLPTKSFHPRGSFTFSDHRGYSRSRQRSGALELSERDWSVTSGVGSGGGCFRRAPALPRRSGSSRGLATASTLVLRDNVVKVVAWYDNEWGYSARMVDIAAVVAGA